VATEPKSLRIVSDKKYSSSKRASGWLMVTVGNQRPIFDSTRRVEIDRKVLCELEQLAPDVM
jgi:hypothetical protein